MDRLLKSIIGIFLSCGLIFRMMGSAVWADTESKWMNLDTEVKSMTSIRLSWKKKAVAKYRLYRAAEKNNGDISKYQKIATISGKKTSYLDKKRKKKTMYHYMIRGYDKKGNLKYRGEAENYTGLWCSFFEYQIPDAKYSTEEIQLQLCSSEGLKPDAYCIYRKQKGDTAYHLLKVVKKKTWYVDYRDKAVKKGKVYFYKFRTYKTIGKKKYYSKYSNQIRMSATNQVGIFKAKIVEDQQNHEDEITFMLTSQDGNGEIILQNCAGFRMEKQDGSSVEGNVRAIEYSKDGNVWTKVDQEKEGNEMTTLNAGKNIWIRGKVSEQIKPLDQLQEFKLYMEWLKYNDLKSSLEIDLIGGDCFTSVIEEAYH